MDALSRHVRFVPFASFCTAEKQWAFSRFRRTTLWHSMPGAGAVRHINNRHRDCALPPLPEVPISRPPRNFAERLVDDRPTARDFVHWRFRTPAARTRGWSRCSGVRKSAHQDTFSLSSRDPNFMMRVHVTTLCLGGLGSNGGIRLGRRAAGFRTMRPVPQDIAILCYLRRIMDESGHSPRLVAQTGNIPTEMGGTPRDSPRFRLLLRRLCQMLKTSVQSGD